jgi:heptosyltransferase-2/heptosyltransferase-3
VVLHPGGGSNPGMAMLDKRWPQPRFVELADRLQQAGFQIVLTGTADDRPLCQAIADRVHGNTPQILAGRITLGQFGALCRRVALFVGGDTGAMHLAVASGCKTIAIFGPSDPRRYGAFAAESQAISLWRTIDIPPGGVGQGRVVNFSWEGGINVEEVWQACQKLLGGSA